MPKGKNEKAMDHKRHMKSQREKELKRKEKRNLGLLFYPMAYPPDDSYGYRNPEDD